MMSRGLENKVVRGCKGLLRKVKRLRKKSFARFFVSGGPNILYTVCSWPAFYRRDYDISDGDVPSET